MANSNRKGKRLERELASLLRNEGFGSARRGQQRRGGPDSPDVLCEDLPRIHWESKGGKQLRLKDFMEQAADEAPEGSVPVVAWREDRQPWRVILNLEDFCAILRDSGYCGS